MVAGEDASTRAGKVVRTFDLAGEVEAERGEVVRTFDLRKKST